MRLLFVETLARLAALERPRRAHVLHDEGVRGPRPRGRTGDGERAERDHAIDGLPLEARFDLESSGSLNGFKLHTSWLQTRFRSFWGVEERQIAALVRATDVFRPDAVIVSGLDALPYFPALSGVTRVWYAADEWVLHHLTLIQPAFASVKEHLRAAAIKESTSARIGASIDRVWVVSERDRRAMRWARRHVHGSTSCRTAWTVSSSDPGAKCPSRGPRCSGGVSTSDPNIQALEWFCRKVWPLVRQRRAGCAIHDHRISADDAVRALARPDQGITSEADLRDLRSAARRRALAVLPFVSGAGIKNKLLEAAALGLPIVCTPLAARGLRGDSAAHGRVDAGGRSPTRSSRSGATTRCAGKLGADGARAGCSSITRGRRRRARPSPRWSSRQRDGTMTT